MDFPHGRRDDAPAPAYGRDDDEGRDAPAPAYRSGGVPAPSLGRGGGGYGRVARVSLETGEETSHYYGPGGPKDDYGTPAPSIGRGGGGVGRVVHLSHESGEESLQYDAQTRPHHGGAAPVATQPTYRIVCKAGEDSFSLGARGGKVCLVPTDEDDDAQRWIKDMKFSTRVKDEEGYPAIVLVNKATGEALKHSLGQSHPVLLTRFNPDSLDESVLWTESRDVGEGYRCIRMVNNIYLNFDALNGDPDHGGVRDGTTLVLWEWAEGDNQRWKIVAW